MSKPISIADCVWWLDHLEEGCTIGDTDMKFIDRIQGALEQLLDEIDAANTANRDLFK